MANDRSESKAVATYQTGALTNEQVELLKRTICRGATEEELQIFLHVCNRRQLDPFARQIYAVKRWDSALRREVMAIQTSIDGYRLIAERSGKYAGQIGPLFTDDGEHWVEAWLKKTPPAAAKVGVLRRDFQQPLWAVALFNNYAAYDKDGHLTRFWEKMGPLMIGKVAEALSLRRAFPEELSGLYIKEEMDQADAEFPHSSETGAPGRLDLAFDNPDIRALPDKGAADRGSGSPQAHPEAEGVAKKARLPAEATPASKSPEEPATASAAAKPSGRPRASSKPAQAPPASTPESEPTPSPVAAAPPTTPPTAQAARPGQVPRATATQIALLWHEARTRKLAVADNARPFCEFLASCGLPSVPAAGKSSAEIANAMLKECPGGLAFSEILRKIRAVQSPAIPQPELPVSQDTPEGDEVL